VNLPQLLIVKADTKEQYSDVQHLHRTIWSLDDIEVIPQHILIAAQKSGGLVLCAYDAERPVGFSFGFCALMDDGTIGLYSHNLGVLEEYRDFGVGYQIKLAQRNHMLQRSIPVSYWTFDPLESRNAYFNVEKLRCVCRRYIIDYYGPMRDGLNAQLPSDRLIAEWWVTSTRVTELLEMTSRSAKQRSLKEPTPDRVMNPSREHEEGFRRPAPSLRQFIPNMGDTSRDYAYIEIPANYQEMRERDLGLALEWRLTVRAAFETCFSQYLVVTGVVFTGDRSYYLLEKEQPGTRH